MPSKLITTAAFRTGAIRDGLHFHNGYEMIFVKKGEIAVTIENVSFHAREGTLIFISNLENHTLKMISSDFERYFCNLSPLECDKVLNDVSLLSLLKYRQSDKQHTHAVALDEPSAKEMGHLFQKLVEEYEGKDGYGETLLKGYIREILIIARRHLPEESDVHTGGIRRRLYEMQSYLDAHFAEEIRIEELAKKYYTNHYYLSHAFKEFTGYSPKQYLTLLRLNRAATLLVKEGYTVADAAIACGFSNPNNFIRCFKNHYHMTPTDYRKKVFADETI